MIRKKVILYNPRAVFWTMPLSLLAVGSAVDRLKYDVVIIDGRLEADPLRAVLSQVDPRTLCLGITVLTGNPIGDARAISHAVKTVHPQLPIIWGGWHPSLFPAQCLKDPSVDAVITGQGEETFTELIDRLARGEQAENTPGCLAQSDRNGSESSAGAPRAFHDINRFPAHDYSLIDVEAYFARKGCRQLDYVSSQGCRFRCSFCPDPSVFRREWSGLQPERMVAELKAHYLQYGYAEVSFQDENFFTSPKRVMAIAEGFLSSGLTTAWLATMRSDQGARLDDAVFGLLRRSGLKRVLIGVESGSPEMLRRINKDITIAQIFDSAEKCARHAIGAIFNFIVGFPGESNESIQQTLDAAARLRAMSPDFEVCIFYFKPYPGNPIAEELVRSGHQFPSSLEGWTTFDIYGRGERWVTKNQRRLVDRFQFYQRYAFSRKRSVFHRTLQALSAWRVGRRMYFLPIEKLIVETIRPRQRLS